MQSKRKELNLDVVNAPTLFKIICIQKITFEQARIDGDYDTMRNSLQNILDNLESKARKESKGDSLTKIYKVLDWYDTLQFNKKYLRRTSDGSAVHRFPINIRLKVDRAMRYVYRNINKLIDDLNIV